MLLMSYAGWFWRVKEGRKLMSGAMTGAWHWTWHVERMEWSHTKSREWQAHWQAKCQAPDIHSSRSNTKSRGWQAHWQAQCQAPDFHEGRNFGEGIKQRLSQILIKTRVREELGHLQLKECHVNMPCRMVNQDLGYKRNEKTSFQEGAAICNHWETLWERKTREREKEEHSAKGGGLETIRPAKTTLLHHFSSSFLLFCLFVLYLLKQWMC